MLLDEIARFLAEPHAPFKVGFSLERTGMWAAAVAEAGMRRLDVTRSEAVGPLAVMDELRLDPSAWRRTRRAALLDELVAARTAAAPEDERAALADLREGLGLADRVALNSWARDNDTSPRSEGPERKRLPCGGSSASSPAS